MNIWNGIIIGLSEIWAHKFRSLLTMLGIILGVSSLVAMSALVQGMENGMKEALVAMGGLEKIEVQPRDGGDLPLHQRHLADQAPGLRLSDITALNENGYLISELTPAVEMTRWGNDLTVTYADKVSEPFFVSGTWPIALELNEHVIEYGRMFNEIDNEETRSVCVIGTGIRDDLFGDPAVTGEEVIPLGEVIVVQGQPFTIIGMFTHYDSEKGLEQRKAAIEAARNKTNQGEKLYNSDRGRSNFAFRIKNNQILVPLNSMIMKFRSGNDENPVSDPRLSELTMKIPSVELLNPALQQVRNVLLMTHNGIEDFTFRTQEDWAEGINTSIKNARMSGGVIAAISLVVGGIGIMNIMLASISERVREIGIRKAIGATTGSVFAQILIESIVIAIFGGIAGLGASYALVQFIASFSPDENQPVITIGAMTMAFGFSVMIGAVAGLYPAIKASILHPIQALRYD